MDMVSTDWYILHVTFLFILPPVLLSKSPLACKFVLLSEASTSLSILIRDLLKFLWEGRDGELPPLQNVPQKLVDKLGNIRKILNIIITRLCHVKVAQRNELLIIDFSACRNEHFIFFFIFLYSNGKCDGLPNQT